MKFSELKYERTPFEGAEAKVKDLIAQMQAASDAQAVLALHKQITEVFKHVSTMESVCYVRNTLNVTDEFYKKEMEYYDETSPLFQNLSIEVYRTMLQSPHLVELKQELGELFFINADIAVRSVNEAAIPFMQQANKLTTEYQELLAKAKIEFDGKELNLPQLRAYMLSPDREVRKAAYSKRTEYFMNNEQKLDEIFDKLVKLRHECALALGYENFVELGYLHMNRNSYNASDVAKFRDQVKKVLVPYVTKLHEERAKRLGIDKLKFYDDDIFFPHGNPTPKGTPDEIFANGRKMYEELSPETNEFINYMLDNELFDCLAKQNKSGGGYCIGFADYDMPFVFANFNGTSEDVDVLTHECGHALANYLSKSIPVYELKHGTYEVCEIHSMTMEFMTTPYMHLFFENPTEFAQMQLQAAFIFIPYGCMVDEFQHIIYENPNLTPDERKQKWLELEAEYRPHMDYDGDPYLSRGGTWQRQSHIYQRPFYYIDYCLAQFCALQFNAAMQKDKSTWDRYISLVKQGGSKAFTQLITEAGLSSPFAEGAFEFLLNQ